MSQTDDIPASALSEPVLARTPRLHPDEASAAAGFPWPWLRCVTVVALLVIPTLKLTERIADPDIWWHLRTGEWVLEHEAVPRNDPFSTYGQARPWVAYSWLFEVLVYECHQALGLRGIVLVTVVMAYLISYLLYRFITRRIRSFLPAAALTAAALLSLTVLFSPRPWLFSMLFSIVTLDAVLHIQERRARWSIWLLPVIFVLWANIHIQFIYGLIVLGLACVVPLLRVLGGERIGCQPPPCSPSWYQLVSLFLLCLLATLLNPYHIRLYGVMWDYANQLLPSGFVRELQAPQFRAPYEWLMLLLFGLAAGALGARRRWDPFSILLLAGAAALGFLEYRDLWVIVFASVATLCQAWQERHPLPSAAAFQWTPLRILAVSGAAASLSLFLLYSEGAVDEIALQRTVDERFPTSVPTVIAERRFTGPLYNDMNWGGYLIWALPKKGVDMPVAIDLRTNLHAGHLQRFADTGYGQPGWDQDPDLSEAGIVLLHHKWPLAELVSRDPRFEEIALTYSPARLFVARKNRPASGAAAEAK